MSFLTALPSSFRTLLDGAASEDISQTKLISIFMICSSSFPMLISLVIFLSKLTDARNAYDHNITDILYIASFIMSFCYILLAVIGFRITKEEHQLFYISVCILSFILGSFAIFSFVGFFVSPVSIAFLMTLGVGTILLDSKQIFFAFILLILLVILSAYLHVKGYVELLPVTPSLVLANEYNLVASTLIYTAVVPIICLIFAASIYLFMKSFRNTSDQLEILTNKLSKYLSPQVYDAIFSGDMELDTITRRKSLTIFFADLVGFNEFLDEIDSQQAALVLNTYLDEMSSIAIQHGGTIDKFIGNSIMIFFGDPYSSGVQQDAINCVLMAIAMRNRFNDLLKNDSDSPLSVLRGKVSIRIGINTGFCTVGDFGSNDRMDYTIIGGQVNLASRLKANAAINTILISHETYSLIDKKIRCFKKNKIKVKGIQREVQTYEVQEAYYDASELDDELLRLVENFKRVMDFDRLSDKRKSGIAAIIKNRTL